MWHVPLCRHQLPGLSVATIYLRSTLPETPRYTTDVSPRSPSETFLQGSSSAFLGVQL